MISKRAFLLENQARISRRKTEWRISCALGVILFLLSFTAIKIWLGADASGTLIIKLSMIPIISYVLIKPWISKTAKEVKEVLNSNYDSGSDYFPEMYEMLIALDERRSEQKLSARYRVLQLIAVVSSFYILSMVIGIFINYILVR